MDKTIASDAEWYCAHNEEEERYYSFFFRYCRKYKVNWASASEKEKQFIEEITRVTYERDKAERMGVSAAAVRPSFDD